MESVRLEGGYFAKLQRGRVARGSRQKRQKFELHKHLSFYGLANCLFLCLLSHSHVTSDSPHK